MGCYAKLCWSLVHKTVEASIERSTADLEREKEERTPESGNRKNSGRKIHGPKAGETPLPAFVLPFFFFLFLFLGFFLEQKKD